MKLRPVLAVFRKDLLDGIKNYHVILMVLTPIILSLLLANVLASARSGETLPEIGVISSPQQPLIESIAAKGLSKKLSFFQTRQELEAAILEGQVKFGIMLPEIFTEKKQPDDTSAITLLYPPQMPEFAIDSLKSTFEFEIRAQLNMSPPPLPFEFRAEPVGGGEAATGGISDSMFPMLILMAIGMVGFLALPMAIVEEREKGTFNAIFLSPISVSEFISGKTIFSFCLAQCTVLIMLMINNKWGPNPGYILIFSTLGSLMTIFTGLIISYFANTQGSVNAIGTTFFLFFQMIPTLQQTSPLIRRIAPYFPSTYIFSGIRKAMFLDLSKVDIRTDLTVVAISTGCIYLISFLLLKLKKADK